MHRIMSLFTFHTHRGLKSVCVFAQSDQSLSFPPEETFGHWIPIEHPLKTLIRLRGYAGHARIQKVLSGGPTLMCLLWVFLVGEGREVHNTTLSGPSTARQRNANKWRFAGVLMMVQH